jgi:hypothetical protein
MGPNRRAQEREQAAARAAEEAKRAEAKRQAIAEAQRVVAIWMRARRAAGSYGSIQQSAPRSQPGSSG